MTTPSQLDRRRLLTAFAAFGAFGPAVATAGHATPMHRHLHDLLQHEADAAAHLGRAYLAAHPDEADPATLLRRLEADHPGLTASVRQADHGAVKALLARGIRHDFTIGRTDTVAGWVMARTEARLCALHVFDASVIIGSTS